MRKFAMVVLLISFFQISHAQEVLPVNKYITGGSINFLHQNNTYPLSSLSIISGIGGIYSSNTDEIKNTSFAFTPYFGKEINPRLMVGLQLDYRLGKYKAEDIFIFGQTDPVDLERNSNQIGIGLFSRHLLNPDNKFILFVQPYFEYNILNQEEAQGSNITREEKASYFELGAGLGVLYNINSKIRATLRTGGLTYVNGKWEIKDTDTEKDFSSFGTTINLSSIFFGFEFRI
ncbi:MAG: outer membrane beta-barrel protein [Saprospiraceae bacterium]|nr:outer membrane beta-barrel protein [Saprospiraceae bacterium]